MGAPPGAGIDQASGLFNWTPSAAQASTTNTIQVVATDNGQPPLSGRNAFSVIVATALKITDVTQADTSISFSWNSVAGRTDRVMYKTNLNDTIWQQLGPDIPGTGPTTSKTDPAGPGSGKFYKVLLVP